MDFFEDGVSKRERRHVKHGLADVPTQHALERMKERRNLSTRPITVCASGKRIVVTHVPRNSEHRADARRWAAPAECNYVHVVASSHSPGRIIGRNGYNLRPLQCGGVFVRVESNERGGAHCVVEGDDEARVLKALERLKALLQSL